MTRPVVYLTLPGLAADDVDRMPALAGRVGASRTRVEHSFPCVTWPAQAAMLTGEAPNQSGVVANGFYWRDEDEVEMWTAWNDRIERPQIWEMLRGAEKSFSSAAWFPMLSKGSRADVICMPAPVHNPDGSESPWCYSKPEALYGQLMDRLGPFPLMNFWGPMANIKSSKWIAESAVMAMDLFRPDFFYIYLPHLDYAAQRHGPDSPEAEAAVQELDALLADWFPAVERAYGDHRPIFVAQSEYTIVPVNHVAYPNRILRKLGLLALKEANGQEEIDRRASKAWALVDHQFSHIFVRDADATTIAAIKRELEATEGFAEVLAMEERRKYAMDHPRSGEIVAISTPNSWQAYYWWEADDKAPAYARTVDIHQKPGYDPVELFFDSATKSIPLDATLVKGSHGAPAVADEQRGVLLCSEPTWFPEVSIPDQGISMRIVQKMDGRG
ncbi:MAG TPA: nucleotide pyrophosphatase/phosphodiesterase family protein [Pirellulaceae bacterium]|nr:nucleotide pyrophosphatase/phosphodiesterase family protein [Pirellulaceae bacterium]